MRPSPAERRRPIGSECLPDLRQRGLGAGPGLDVVPPIGGCARFLHGGLGGGQLAPQTSEPRGWNPSELGRPQPRARLSERLRRRLQDEVGVALEVRHASGAAARRVTSALLRVERQAQRLPVVADGGGFMRAFERAFAAAWSSVVANSAAPAARAASMAPCA